MDNNYQNFTGHFSFKASKNMCKVIGVGVDDSTITTLQLDSPRASSLYFSNSKGSKRRSNTIDGSIKLCGSSSLFLGLGCSSSSCTNLLPEKDIKEVSVTDFGPSMKFNPSCGQTHDANHASHGNPKVVEVSRPKLDLELSLSTGTAESDVTSVTQSIPFQNSTETPVVGQTVQLLDEGSTSSLWKRGPLVPPLQSVETSSALIYAHPNMHSAPLIPNLSSNTTVTPKDQVACASGVVDLQQQRHNNAKTCRFGGCTKGARGASGLCIAHGGGRRCQRVGCQKGAEGKTVFCKAHGGGRRCQHLGCTKSAEGRTDYCIGHGGGRRCSQEGCARAARGKSGLCIRHGGGKRCKVENCAKSAEGIFGLCIYHGGGRRCQYPSCTKGAQGSTMFCKAHGGGKRCIFLGCTKGAEGITSFCKGHGGGKRCTFEGGCSKSVHGGTAFCVNHGGGKRCAMTGCTKSARGRTDFCVRHGGGRRCKFSGCTKSAQGSTDFCKAHGGGRRCSWGQLGSEPVGKDLPCDKFARGKSGLCAAHSAQLQDRQIHSSQILQETESGPFNKLKRVDTAAENNYTNVATLVGSSIDIMGLGRPSAPMRIPVLDNFSVKDAKFSVPEGRVHGGNLMAMLRGSADFVPSHRNQVVDDSSEPGTSYSIPHSWV